MSDLTGQTFAGYEILAKLGEGGMGAVYKARQPTLNRLVALKVMASQLSSDSMFVSRFRREANAAAALNHENIVQVFTAGESDGTHYIAMEFVEGKTLRDHIDSHGKLDPREAIAITVYVATALQYAWSKAKLIHRDIKPENIFLSNTGEVKVGDLGLAKTVGGATTNLTQTGMMMGSPHYISPEQARGAADIDFRTDIYSLGCTLYHMLTGRPPYSGSDPLVVITKHVNDPPPAIFKVWSSCPVPLGMLVGKMLAKNRNDRFASYEELIAEMIRVREKLAPVVSAPPASASEPTKVAAATPKPAVAKTPKPAPAAKPGLAIRNWKLVMGGVAAVALIAGAVWWFAGRASSPDGVALPEGYRPIFNGKDLSGWKVRDAGKYNAWTAQDGVLVNTQAGTDLITEEQFTDFLFHCEFKIPPGGNSGVYLRGRYEIQIYDDFGQPSGGQTSGGIFKVITPSENASKPAGEWQSLSAGIRGKHVEVVLNGKKVIDYGELTKPTGDALDKNVDQPGPIMLQGRYGRVEFRNIRTKPLTGLAPSAPDAVFLREVAALSAEQQVKRVVAKLKELNPDFDPSQATIDSEVKDGQVSMFKLLSAWKLTDLSPVRALSGLKWLELGEAKAADLTPLKGLRLERFLLHHMDEVSDLSPLQGMPLKYLLLEAGRITDLNPLKGMPLETLHVSSRQVSDVSPLSGMTTLRSLRLHNVSVSNLSPLKGLGLASLHVGQAKVSDLSPLRDMPLKSLECEPDLLAREPNRTIVRSIATLQTINKLPAAEFWKQVDAGKLPDAAPASAAQPGETKLLDLGGGVKMELVSIPPGELMLGSTKEEQAWAVANGAMENYVKHEGEAPRKAVIKHGFWMGRTEVTVGQWKQFVAATGYKSEAEKKGFVDYALRKGQSRGRVDGLSWRDQGLGSPPQDNHPVSCVSWNDAVAFCQWATERERKAGRIAAGQMIRLPTEAEWEYACRAGAQTRFWWGDAKEDGKGRLNLSEKNDGYEFMAPADAFGARGRNGFGLADMLGNVDEWCLDEFDATGAHEDLWTGNPGTRVLRGGAFRRNLAVARCAYRYSFGPSISDDEHGFRVCLGPDVLGAAPASATPTDLPKETSLDLGGGVKMELALVPAGEFIMGSNDGPGYEKPVHKVRISAPFYMGKYEVTITQFKRFVAETQYQTEAERFNNGWMPTNGRWGPVPGVNWRTPVQFTQVDDHPVCVVSWNDIQEFCKWASKQTGRIVRLPTEAQWEYACRAGTTTKFNTTDKDSELGEAAWFAANSGQRTHPVGQKKPNAWGLYDMHGNLYEMVQDFYSDKYDVEQFVVDPQGSTTGGGRQMRGGGWGNNPASVRSACRKKIGLDEASIGNGFRVVTDALPATGSVASTSSATGDAAWQNTINLLLLVDLSQDVNSGKWEAAPDGLKATDIKSMSQKIQPPYRPPEEYDYRVSFTPMSGNADVAIGLTARGRSFVFYMKKFANDHCLGFEAIGGKAIAAGPTAHRFPHLEMGSRYTVVVEVRKNGLRGYLDDKLVAEWSTDYSDMTAWPVWKFKDDTLPGFGCSLSTVVFQEVKLREVGGKGTFTRGGSKP
ncbi:MAG: SUMF1/EgtB/PvdO family nonheme iron enzyme [Verrucomicrobia bacterium]|nr:SUMF1/EgtB/PvdO family nonheme iron enzyme [Verrucomicrobiota bacterium]